MTTLSQLNVTSEASSFVRTQAVDECKTSLAAEILRAGDSIRLQVLGSSMLHSICPGDVVSIDKVSVDEIVPGDIVVCERDDRLFVHRLIGKSESKDGIRWETRGDSMPHNDLPFSEGQLLGRVSQILRGDRVFTPKRTRSILGRFLSWMICYLDSAKNLALRLHALRTNQWIDSPQARSRSTATELPRSSREGRLAPR